ncbi:MAG: 4-amino-4-deoxy-L-arabinose transferase, partial [Flavobacteriales bacterium]|nr:4-amino-4-deoxy-L-arabinose transferase [Flavobacteriales bacterium]
MNTASTIRIFFYLLWFISLLIQASFTELTADEAYYWMYAQDLSWGYFDHPPVIAALIKSGYALFCNELGVRLIPVILSTLTIVFLEKIVNAKEVKTFFMLVASVGILHFIGFFAIPDSPFICLSAAFLLVYKNYLASPDVKKSILLGCIFALMCMSKYHAVVLIGLTVLSNPKLLSNRHFWLSGLIATGLLAPHFLWQFNAGFPSFQYHLFERSAAPYELTYTLEYLASQLFVLGPITG